MVTVTALGGVGIGGEEGHEDEVIRDGDRWDSRHSSWNRTC